MVVVWGWFCFLNRCFCNYYCCWLLQKKWRNFVGLAAVGLSVSRLSVGLSVCLPVCLSVCWLVGRSVFLLLICLSVGLSVYLLSCAFPSGLSDRRRSGTRSSKSSKQARIAAPITQYKDQYATTVSWVILLLCRVRSNSYCYDTSTTR